MKAKRRWKTYFERINFGFDPPLRQTADVVFETTVPFEDEYSEKFEKAAWDAMWKQNPHWENSDGQIKGAGWSSVLGGSQFEEV